MNILLNNKSAISKKRPFSPSHYISLLTRHQWIKSIILLAILVNIAGFSDSVQATCKTYDPVSERLSVGTYISEATALQGMDDYWSTVDFNVVERGLRASPCANYSYLPGHTPLRNWGGNNVQLYQYCVAGTFNDTNCTNIHYHVYAYFPIEGASCPEGRAPDQQTGRCEAEAALQLAKDAKNFGAPSCGVGNPCDPSTGNKYQQEVDIPGETTGLALIRHYNSGRRAIDNGFGYGWSHQLAPSLEVSANLIVVHQVDGRAEAFRKTEAQWQGDSDSQLSLSQDSTGFTLRTDQGRRERYDLTGHLLSQTEITGQQVRYRYNSEQQLETLTGHFGHVLRFSYNADQRIASVTDPAQQVVQYHYDEKGNLVNVTYPDQSTRHYHYENPDHPHALTGITDENGSRYATYTYNAAGQAIATAHAQTDNPVPQEHFELQYEDNQTTVTDATDQVEIYRFEENLDVKNLISRIHQSDGKGVTQRFDTQNNLISRTDAEGTTTTLDYNAAGQLIRQTEAAGTPLARSTEFKYLSDTLNLITEISVPSIVPDKRKITRISYHPDHSVESLAIDGYLPDGSVIQRRHTFQTNTQGQVTQIDGPRDDVADITTFSYYDCDTGGRCGQLASLSNALNHTVTFDQYDPQGRLTQQTDPQSVVTTYRYDTRGRLTNITETPPPGQGRPRTTTYHYDHAGQLTTLILPDGQELSYQYDAAHQLRRIRDSLGNQQSYRYDANGNQTQVHTLDPEGTLVRTLQLGYDSRNRVTTINRAGAISRLIRDAAGNPLSQTDAKQHPDTTYEHDALHRLIQTLDSLGQATQTHYDHQDHLIQVEAPNQAVTDYQVDDLGNRLQETSADRGTVSYRHDQAGNITHVTDARGITRTIHYDALSRVTSIDYSGNEEDITYRYDDCPNGIGRLCQIDDASGITQYRYDSWGNILSEARHTQDTIVTTHYTYDTSYRILTLTYPDGSTVRYQRDRIGRVTGVSRENNGTTIPLMTERHYRADGLMIAQTLGNGLTETRQYDLQGRLSQQTLGEDINRSYQYDANGNLISQQQGNREQHYDYDELDRLVTEASLGKSKLPDQINYHYDANGNRLSTDRDGKLRLLDYEAESNRLTESHQHPINRDAAGKP